VVGSDNDDDGGVRRPVPRHRHLASWLIDAVAAETTEEVDALRTEVHEMVVRLRALDAVDLRPAPQTPGPQVGDDLRS